MSGSVPSVFRDWGLVVFQLNRARKMTKIRLMRLLLLSLALLAAAPLTSCTSNNKLNEDGTYTAPPSLNSVDQTTRMQSKYRDMRN